MKPDSRFPRLRAVVRTFTSPRRVWFWTTTLPVLLGAVALYLVMRPGVVFDWSTKVGAVEVLILRVGEAGGGRAGMAWLHWPRCTIAASCFVPVAGRPTWPAVSGIHRLGPLVAVWKPGDKAFGIDAHWFGLGIGIKN